MRIYHHPKRTGWIVAKSQQGTTVELPIQALPIGREAGRAYLTAIIERAETPSYPDEDGNPMPLSALEPKLSPYIELDQDDQAEMAALLEQARTVEDLKPIIQSLLDRL